MSKGIIQKLQRISTKLFKQSIKTFTYKDATPHIRASVSNLVENLARFPGAGLGFKVRRKTWPAGTFYIIKDVKFKSVRFGRFYGIYYQKNQPIDTYPKKMAGCNKRGVWEYSLGNFQSIRLDNGMVYNRSDIEYYYQHITKKNIKKQKQQVENQVQGEAETEIPQTN